MSEVVKQVSGDTFSGLWRYLRPSPGAQDCVVAFSGGGEHAISLLQLDYVSGQIGDTKGATNASGNSISLTLGGVTTADMSIDALFIGPAETPSAGADQTVLQTVTGIYGYGASRQATTDGVMSWGWTTSSLSILATANFVYSARGGNQVFIMAARRWQEFLKELKQGLVPPDVLRERYRDLVTI